MRELICKRVFFVISKTFRFWKYLKSKICAWEEWSDHVGSTLISLGMFKVMLSWRSQGCWSKLAADAAVLTHPQCQGCNQAENVEWWGDSGREASLADVYLTSAEGKKVENVFWGIPVQLLYCRPSVSWVPQVCCGKHSAAKISGKEKDNSGIW